MTEPEISTAGATPRVALVSMPWMALSIPSIQLAVLSAALKAHGIAADRYELFLDYAARIGVPLYIALSNAGGFIEEWLFAQHYYGPEQGDYLHDFRAVRPKLGLASRELEDEVLDALIPVTAEYLDQMAGDIDWGNYDVVGFSLTISQTAASMALARLIKRRHPAITIVFGGAACAGPMGPAIARICPYVDVVVSVEGERILPALLLRLAGEATAEDRFAGLDGISYRAQDGSVRVRRGSGLIAAEEVPAVLDFDPYFDRASKLQLLERLSPWLPFESSRGCWYGQKSQCTFCGLHEIMQYRPQPWERVLSQLERWEAQYGCHNFFSVDLIMPLEYLQTLLPEVRDRGHEWSIFYEVKANLKRSQLEILAASGVRWIQPGIESLDDDVLQRMRKGVSALQNIQLLKWCRELGIHVTWNLIVGTPGELHEAYDRMARLIPRLVHLEPPSGTTEFQLHRFSPTFEHPEEFGIERTGAHPLFRHIYRVEESDLDDLVYLHDYRIARPRPLSEYLEPVQRAIQDWKSRWREEASLLFLHREDGSAILQDGRGPELEREHLSPAEAGIYAELDEIRSEAQLLRQHESSALTGGHIESLLDHWDDRGWIIRSAGKVVALALHESRRQSDGSRQQPQWVSPVAYLGQAAARDA